MTQMSLSQTCGCGRGGEGRAGRLGLADANYSRGWTNSKVLLCNTGNDVQSPGINHNGKYRKEHIYVYN